MRLATAIVLSVVTATTAEAQTPDEPRGIVLTDVGYARTMDDEGYLGSGASLRVGAGFRVTPRWTIQAVVDRIPYYRNVEYLTFDGRVIFVGVEAAFQSRNPRVRPYVTIGAGVMNDDRIWIHKTIIDPFLPRVEERTEHHYALKMLTASTGLDFKVSERGSIRAGARFHGLLDTGMGRDLAPHVILQPNVGAAWRW